MSQFKLVGKNNDVIFSKLVPRNEFCFMELLKSFYKDTGLDESFINLKKSIELINQENGMEIKAILHVEDESLLRDMSKTFGTKLGHYIRTVPNSEVAEKIIVKDPSLYSIVLLDKHLPGLDGDKFGIKLKSYNPSIEVCIVTGDPKSIDSDILKKGIDRVIQKPLSFNIFKNTIGETSKKVA